MDTQETPDESSRLPSTSLDVRSDSPPSGPDLGATDARDVQVHDHNCAGGCGGWGYRYPNATEESEECTGRPYRFAVKELNEDNGSVRTVLATDSTDAVARWLDSDDPCIWVTDREFVAPPPPVDLVKYGDCPF